jgi:hypothetical protein
MRGDDAIEYPQHLTRDLRAAGEADTQLEWKTERLLAHWLVREYLIYEQGRTLGHAARAATRTEPTTLTTEHNQASPVAGFTAYPQEPVFEPAALQVVLEFPLHMAQLHPTFFGQVLPENRVVRRRQLIEQRLLEPMALIEESVRGCTSIPSLANGGHGSLT